LLKLVSMTYVLVGLMERPPMTSGLYPLAALVFFASILVPVLKLASLAILLICTQAGWIGIFMESILIALVQFGSVVTIDPWIGVVAFASVVILTMFAAESFVPRLMWDEASPPRERSPCANQPTRAPSFDR